MIKADNTKIDNKIWFTIDPNQAETEKGFWIIGEAENTLNAFNLIDDASEQFLINSDEEDDYIEYLKNRILKDVATKFNVKIEFSNCL